MHHLFHPNVSVETKDNICKELNIMFKALSDTYLGLPTMVGLTKVIVLEYPSHKCGGFEQLTRLET